MSTGNEARELAAHTVATPAHPLASSSLIMAMVKRSSPAPPNSLGTDRAVMPDCLKIRSSSSSITPLLSIERALGAISFCAISRASPTSSFCLSVKLKSIFQHLPNQKKQGFSICLQLLQKYVLLIITDLCLKIHWESIKGKIAYKGAKRCHF